MIQNNPLVSVVIPTCNRALLLSKTLESLKIQSYKNIEIIVVDDNSSQNTQQLVSSFDLSIIYTRFSQNQGPSVTRNKGIQLAKGDFVLFLDDDDLLHPSHIEEMVTASLQAPNDVIVSSRWRKFGISDETVFLDDIKAFTTTKEKEQAIADIIDPTIQDTICNPSLFWRREVFNSIQWDETLFTNGDLDFFLQALNCGYSFKGVEKGMVYYRMHEGVRVAAKQTKRSILSSARHRLKWSTIFLKEFGESEKVRCAFRNSFMSLMINFNLLAIKESGIQSLLKEHFRKWGGSTYYLTHKRSGLKHAMAESLMNLVGLKMIRYLNAVSNSLKKGNKNIIGEGFMHYKTKLSKEHLENNILFF
jgi:glycosyltransferase involved in cell wall biosynthesis